MITLYHAPQSRSTRIIGLLEERAGMIEAETGCRPVVSGTLTRS